MWHLFDVKREDRVFWLTDIGWMMGPWLILGTLTLGATVVMYDGAPDYPTVNRLWEVWDRHKVTIGGISPTFIRSVMPYGTEYFKGDHLSSLRVIGSTGEPWNPLPWLWTFDHVGRKKVPIINYSGGTEISGGILGCTFFRPLKPTSFNTVVPGVRAEVWNDDGKRVLKEVGYLVVLNPNPGMTRGFYNDLARYEETYFSRFPGVWFHGDLCYEDQDGFFYILGRADDTIKVAGKRLGPAEMESVAVEHPKVKESAVIGVPDPKKGEVPVLFVVLKGEIQEEENLKEEIRRWVEERMGKALSPAKIHIVPDLPKTRNAKVMRRVIRRVYLKEDPGDLSSLVNPEILGYFRNLS
jgi:acetyl-CoA synthetase